MPRSDPLLERRFQIDHTIVFPINAQAGSPAAVRRRNDLRRGS